MEEVVSAGGRPRSRQEDAPYGRSLVASAAEPAPLASGCSCSHKPTGIGHAAPTRAILVIQRNFRRGLRAADPPTFRHKFRISAAHVCSGNGGLELAIVA